MEKFYLLFRSKIPEEEYNRIQRQVKNPPWLTDHIRVSK